MKNDWNKYRDYFPVRYFKQGHFDQQLVEFVKKNKVETILDIGGGAFGTEVLKQFNKQVYLLDPNIKSCPDWMVANLDYDHNLKFDLIVARGSINYLTPDQMSKILLWLKPKGTFLANTFLNPPSKDWTERPVTNKEGDVGLERVRLNENKIEHQSYFR